MTIKLVQIVRLLYQPEDLASRLCEGTAVGCARDMRMCLKRYRSYRMELESAGVTILGSGGGPMFPKWNEATIFNVDCSEHATEMDDESCVAAGFYRSVGIGRGRRIGPDRARRSCRQPDDSREGLVAARDVAPAGHARRYQKKPKR